MGGAGLCGFSPGLHLYFQAHTKQTPSCMWAQRIKLLRVLRKRSQNGWPLGGCFGLVTTENAPCEFTQDKHGATLWCFGLSDRDTLILQTVRWCSGVVGRNYCFPSSFLTSPRTPAASTSCPSLLSCQPISLQFFPWLVLLQVTSSLWIKQRLRKSGNGYTRIHGFGPSPATRPRRLGEPPLFC